MLNTKVHEEKMKQILQGIFTSEIEKFLAFKWGTLTYMLHKLDRFSTDIDLDILDIEQESIIIQRIKELLINFGDIKNETLGKTIHRWIFRYDEKGMNIKIELNKRIWTNNTYEPQNINNIPISCMTPDCIFANKLVALSERFVNRDLYDIYFFFREKFPINEALITERTWLSLSEFLQKLIKILPKKFKENTVLKDLWEVLSDKQKSRVKKNLVKESIQQIKTFLSSK